ncbi:MAG TPA: hypothetical protein VFQ05_02745 [Candidatus Eisenbacteria bacterium]|nr:hypothetical protein [Candidatus Eisenbacteria bacterium]
MHEPPRTQPVLLNGFALDESDIGSFEWSRTHNADRLWVTNEGLTIEWDPLKRPPKEKLPPVWIPASTCLHLHSGSYRWDFVVERMGECQIGVGFMLLWDVGPDWGFFGYLGASPTAWAYDPSTGDVVSNTESIEGGLPKFAKPFFSGEQGGVVSVTLDLPRQQEGNGRFTVDGVSSRPIALPPAPVVLPAACLLRQGQRVTLSAFTRAGNGDSGTER